MGNFRTTADYVDSILQLAGEPTNGNSAFEAKALQHLNTAHRSIIMGGNIFNTEVDEVWPWARAERPFRMELLPAIEGSLSITKGSEELTFSAIPLDDNTANAELLGWYLKIGSDPTIYQIGAHTSGSTSAELTSNYVGATGTQTYKAYKLDYVLAPTHITITSGKNDFIHFSEADDKTLLASILSAGVYTPSELATEISTKMTATGASTYTCSYRTDRRTFTIFSNRTGADSAFYLLGENAANIQVIRQRSALPTLGFGVRDYLTDGTAYPDIIQGAIGRLVQPLKIASDYTDTSNIYGMDSLAFDKRFPLSVIKRKSPTHFSVINQTDTGEFTIKLSSYPEERKSIMVDYVPLPVPLYDSEGSRPLFPQQYSEVLEYGAAAKLLMEKEDSKWELYMNLAAKQLDAMMKANRKSSTRYGQRFGQVVAREDLLPENSPRRLRYGYTSGDY